MLFSGRGLRAAGRGAEPFAPYLVNCSAMGVSPCNLAISSTVRPASPLSLWVSLALTSAPRSTSSLISSRGGEEIGCGRVHERGATEGIDGVDVRAVIEQQADAVHVTQHRGAHQRL